MLTVLILHALQAISLATGVAALATLAWQHCRRRAES
jgi:hypothetical protein